MLLPSKGLLFVDIFILGMNHQMAAAAAQRNMMQRYSGPPLKRSPSMMYNQQMMGGSPMTPEPPSVQFGPFAGMNKAGFPPQYQPPGYSGSPNSYGPAMGGMGMNNLGMASMGGPMAGGAMGASAIGGGAMNSGGMGGGGLGGGSMSGAAMVGTSMGAGGLVGGMGMPPQYNTMNNMTNTMGMNMMAVANQSCPGEMQAGMGPRRPSGLQYPSSGGGLAEGSPVCPGTSGK